MANNATVQSHNLVKGFIHVIVNDVYTGQLDSTVINGGGTFVKHGGDANIAGGYMVGGIIDSVVIPNTGYDRHQLAYAFMQYQSRIPQNSAGTVYFGTWDDGENLHLDASERIENLEDAIRVARARGEIAIWDVARAIDIYCSNVYTGENDAPRGYPNGMNE